MAAGIVVGLFAVVIAVFAWSRLSSARADRRSMESYGRALDVLGDVARRNDQLALHQYTPEDTARPHIRTEEVGGAADEAPGGTLAMGAAGTADAPPAAAGAPPTAEVPATAAGAPSAAAGAPPAAGRSHPDTARSPERVTAAIPWSGQTLRFGELGGPTAPAPTEPPSSPPSPQKVPVHLSFGDLEGEPGSWPSGRRVPPPRREPGSRMAVAGAATAAALIAVALLGWKLAGPGTHRTGAPPATNHTSSRHHSPGSKDSRPSPSSTTTSLPSTLKPVSTSSTVVAFDISAKTYVLSFADSGTQGCWIGVQSSPNGPWLWMTTLGPGQTATYDASGPTVVRLGAPRYVGVKVNGIPAELPGFALPYDLTFSAGSGPAST